MLALSSPRSLAFLVLPLLLFAPQDDPAKALRSKDFDTRLAALRNIAGSDSKDREKLLVSALGDDDWQIVEEAAVALGTGGEKAAFKALTKTALGGPVRRVRLAAAHSMGAIDAKGAYDKLARKVAGKEARQACEGIMQFGASVAGEVSLKPLEKALKSKDEHARAAAAHALVLMDVAARAKRLDDLLSHEDLGVRAAALEGARASGDGGLGEVLLASLEKAAANDVLDRRARGAYAELLGGDGAGAVAAAVTGAKKTPHRARLVRLLGDIGVPARSHLVDALTDGDGAVRAAAAGGLSRLLIADKEDEARAALETALANDGDEVVRVICLRALVEACGLEEDGVFDLIVDRLASDADTFVRAEAAVALGMRGLSTALSPLAAALGDSEWTVASAAAVSLGKTREAGAVAPLKDMFSSATDWRLRGAAIVGLCRTFEKAAVSTVISALDDADPLVQRVAYEYLAVIAKRRMARKEDVWRRWWGDNERRIVLLDPEEEKARREKYDYVQSAAEIYKGLDVVVFESRGDHIEVLLSELEINHRLTRQGQVAESETHPSAVFISNCTGEAVQEDIDRLAWFVQTGGYLFGSCWAVQETIARSVPGFVQRLGTNGEVLDEVEASNCREQSPYLEKVFSPGGIPIYHLEGAYLIEVLRPELVEVLIDSPECAQRWGGGNLAAWFRTGHGVVLDSVNHFDLQGFERATGLKKPEDRMAYAIDHMGLTYAGLRKQSGEKFWKKSQEVARRIKDLSVFTLVTNFVRKKRMDGD